jgi:hypothetical protein
MIIRDYSLYGGFFDEINATFSLHLSTEVTYSHVLPAISPLTARISIDEQFQFSGRKYDTKTGDDC